MGILYESSFAGWLVLSLGLGGLCAWMSGRALARVWRPYWRVPVYMVLLACAVRFMHFALAKETLLSPRYYLADALLLIVIATLAYRVTRTTQMVTQYSWLYRRTSPVSWTRI